MKLKYRPKIDGLKAIVVGVINFFKND